MSMHPPTGSTPPLCTCPVLGAHYIKRAVVADTDVILFNIDSKAAHGSGTGRDLILRVFLKVLNELQGYSGDHPHIAHMERYLESKGKLKAFQIAYEKHTGLDWLKERDA